MASTPVSKDQFEINRRGITHKPTGASYTAHPGSPFSGTMNRAQLGNVLKSGDDVSENQSFGGRSVLPRGRWPGGDDKGGGGNFRS